MQNAFDFIRLRLMPVLNQQFEQKKNRANVLSLLDHPTEGDLREARELVGGLTTIHDIQQFIIQELQKMEAGRL